MSILPPGSTVLVTGVSGYIPSHTVSELLKAGFKVRGATRDLQSGQYLKDIFAKYGEDALELVAVPDYTAEGAFDKAVRGVQGIIHMGTVNTFSPDAAAVVTPTVDGVNSVIASAKKESDIKSFVITSSSTAALMPQPGKEMTIQEDTWNDASVARAWRPDPDGFTVYAASKVEAERAFWTGCEGTSWHLSAVLPNMNIGRILKPGGALKSSTGSWPIMLYNGDKTVLNFPEQWFIDVEDTAKLHVIALTDPAAHKRRLFGFAAPCKWNDMITILGKLRPDHKMMELVENEAEDLSKVPNEFAESLLQKHYGHGWTTLEQSIKNVSALLRS